MSFENIIEITWDNKSFKVPFGLGALGICLALGMAWHLDNGFWHIFLDAFLGWIYVAFKLTQYLWPF